MPITINGSTGISGVDGSAGTPALQGGDANTGISFGTDVVIASTGGVERARVDSAGRLLVGTSSAPTATESSKSLLVVNGNTSGGSQQAEILLNNGVDILGEYGLGIIYFGGESNGQVGASIGANAESAWNTAGDTTDSPGRLVFSTTADGAAAPTEKLRIDNAGTIQADGRNGTSTQIFSSILPSPGTSRNHFFGNTVGVGTWALQGNGTSTWTSDERRKKNIEATRDGYLEDLAQLRVVRYNWNVQSDDEPKELGLIAQEVEQVFPGLVVEADEPQDGDDYNLKSVKFSVLPFMLLKALQEAAQKIETLEARITTLEAN